MAEGQNKIFKNTIMLYIRMAIIMVVSLYTSRVVLQQLGVEDFGIYSIVGGVVVSLSFISNTLISSTQRFFSYELGLGEAGELNRVFSMSINIHIVFILISLAILETIGLYVLNYILVIPSDRIIEANIVYQLSILTFCVNLLRIPYNALIISHEQMNIYALLSIVEALLRLSIVFILVLFKEKLVAYGISMFIIIFLINILYMVVCKMRFRKVCRYTRIKDKALFKKMIGFSGWNLLGGITGMTVNEGPNYVMNIFLGVRINAAMGIAKQVSSAVYSFASNFQTAFNPQIVKSYAANDIKQLNKLLLNSSQLSFYLLLVFAVPLSIYSDTVFKIWLEEVPRYAISFSILIMSSQLIAAIGSPLWMIAHAIGDIKRYQISLSIINVMVLPIAWLLLFFKLTPNYVVSVYIVINLLILCYRVFYLRKKIEFPTTLYCKQLLHCCAVAIVCIIPLMLASNAIKGDIARMSMLIIGFFYCVIIIFLLGINKETRYNIIKVLKKNY